MTCDVCGHEMRGGKRIGPVPPVGSDWPPFQALGGSALSGSAR
ncbi:hypothetical protein [Streptomyces sp. bgisy082]